MNAGRRALVTIGLWVVAALVWAAVIGADVTSWRREADTLATDVEPAHRQDSAKANVAGAPGDTVRDRSETAGADVDTARPPAPARDCIDVNAAGLEKLQELPRIGPVLAQRLIDYREAHGRFPDIESLRQVKGIGPATVEKLRGRVCF